MLTSVRCCWDYADQCVLLLRSCWPVCVAVGLQAKTDAQGFTALHVAANRGLLRITMALVEAGADLNPKDSEGDTPLLAALAGG